ncbi:MAG: Bug family tripartite tricarboxylate transporter substrate binding protein [Lautropia sp.]
MLANTSTFDGSTDRYTRAHTAPAVRPVRRRAQRWLLAAVLGSIGLPWAGAAHAQSWPARPIKLVIGFAPGGSGDFVTRLVAAELGRELGVAAVVENRPGAGGNIANETIAKTTADGYTILVAGAMAINHALYKNAGYDPDKDFVPVSRLTRGATIVTAKKDLPVSNLAELVAYGKQNPGKLLNASAGFGSAPHLASALFESVSGVKFTSVQYKGGGPAVLALLAGETDVMFSPPPTVMGHIQSGRIKGLAISQADASEAIPGVPGAAAAGLPGYEYAFWFGLFVPAGTPDAVVQRLHQAASAALNREDVRKRIAVQGMEAAPSASPQAFAAEIRAEAPSLERMIKESGAQVE